MTRPQRRVLVTLTDAHIREQRPVTILDADDQPVIQGRLIALTGVGPRVQVTLNLLLAGDDRWPCVLLLPGDTACVVGP